MAIILKIYFCDLLELIGPTEGPKGVIKIQEVPTPYLIRTRRFGWPTATLLLAPAEGWGTLRVPRILNFEIILFILIDLKHVKNNFIEVLRS